MKSVVTLDLTASYNDIQSFSFDYHYRVRLSHMRDNYSQPLLCEIVILILISAP